MERTRAEHMRWCKERAIAELEYGGPQNALASLLSDFGKHPDTAADADICVLGLAYLRDARGMRGFIDGFAE